MNLNHHTRSAEHESPRIVAAKLADTFLIDADASLGPVLLDDSFLPRRKQRFEQPFKLTIVHLNDLHGYISRSLDHGEQPVISRIAARLSGLREKSANELNAALVFLSAGDDISGSLTDCLLAPDNTGAIIHPSYRLYEHLGLDAAAVGNHDLDFGEKVFAQAAAVAPFPILSANFTSSPFLGRVIYPAAILVRQGVRIGICGITTPHRIKRLAHESWNVADPILTALNLIPALRGICDVVIVLSHLGYRCEEVEDYCDMKLARALPPAGVDLIIGSHSHDVLNEDCMAPANVINGIPIVQAGAFGRLIGEVSFLIEDDHSSPAVTLLDAHLVHTADLPVDGVFEDTHVRPLLDMARPLIQSVIGRVDPDPMLASDATRYRYGYEELPLANFIADALYERCHENGYAVDLAMIDSSVLRAGIDGGDRLTLADWYRVMPYADTIQYYQVTGQQLLAFISDNVFRIGYRQDPIIERGFACFSHHLRYRVMRGRRRVDNEARDLLLSGEPLATYLNHRFLVATHSHFRITARAWESLQWPLNQPPVNCSQWPVYETGLLLREECLNYIRQHQGIVKTAGAKQDGRILFFDLDPV